MARAERYPAAVLPPSLRGLSAVALAMLFLPDASAQDATGQTDPRRSPGGMVTEAPLLPRRGDDTATPPQVFLGERGGVDYAANAAVGRVVVEVDRDGVPADGQSPVKVSVRILGRDGQPLKGVAYATLEHSAGRLLLADGRTDEFGPRSLDADRATPGVQLKVEDGATEFTLLAPDQAQDVRIRITAGDQQASGVVHFVPELRSMIAAGLVEGVVSFHQRVTLTPARQGDAFEQEIQHWARQFDSGKANIAERAAFYLKGTIRGDLLLTAAYDSDKITRSRLLANVRPDEFYPVYGDSSLRSFDAISGSRLFVRIDKDKDYILFGDFVTGDGFTQRIGQGSVASLQARSLGVYNRTATGVRGHVDEHGILANAFAFNDTLRAVIEEFASQGSGPYALHNGSVLEGSDKVEVIVRDRNQPSRILSVRPLVRLVDYTFEPFSGRILLTTFLSSVDENLNPVSLRVTYEADQGGEAFWTGGVDAQWKPTEAIEVGGSAVSERNPLAPYELRSANATVRFGPKTALVAEVAQTTSTVNTNPANQNLTPGLADRTGEVEGRAARLEFAHEGERSDARVFLGRSGSTFNNPAAPLAAGRDEFFATAGYRILPNVRVYADGWKSADRMEGGGSRSAGGVGVKWDATDRLTFDLAVRAYRETVGTQGNGYLTTPFTLTSGLTGSIASGAGGSALGWGNQALDPATGLPIIVQGGLPAATSSLAPGTQLASDTVKLGASWRATDRWRLGAEVESQISGDVRRRYAVGADYQLNERTHLYGRYEHQSGWVQLAGISDTDRSASAFALGVESSFWKDTQVFSEYRLRDAVAGRDVQLASGIRQTFDVAPGWRATVGAEQIRVLDGNTPTSRAVAAGIDYTGSSLWRGSTRIEWRRAGDIASTPDDDRFDTVLWQGMIARKLSRDWTLLGRDYYLRSDYAAHGGIEQNRAQLGVAYRDTDTNRVNALAKIEHKLESDASNAVTGELRSQAWIASAHADWHPSRPWWLTGRVATKWQNDRFEGGATDRFKAVLVAGRLVYDITENWDLGVLGAVQAGQYGARQFAKGVEIGYLLRQNLWLSAGYNATGFKGDPDLVGYEYTRSGAYVRLRFKFDETLFQGRDRDVNRSLDR